MATKTKPTEKTLKIAEAYFQAVTDHDVDAMVALWKPGSIDRLVGLADLRAPDDIRAWFSDMWAALPDAQFTVTEQFASGALSSTQWRMRGTFSGNRRFINLEPTGAEIDITGCDITEVRDGQIVSNTAYLNGAEMARQLGVLPPEGSLPDRAMTGAFNLKTKALRALQERRQR